MGQKTSKTATTVVATKANYNPVYEVVKKYDDAHYGEVKLVREKTTQQEMLLKEVVVNTQKAFEDEVRINENRETLATPHVVNMIGYNAQGKQNFCASFYRVSVFIEALEKTLADNLRDAMELNTPLAETEVLLLADNLITALAYLQSKDINHGDIRPFNVFTTDNEYKLSDPSLNGQRNFDAYVAATVGGSKTLLAPELLRRLPTKELNFVHDRFRADVFSLGATLLSVATLTNSEDLYDYESGTVNENLLQERLDRVRIFYSTFTYELIRDMLVLNEEERTDFTQLDTRVLPYRDNIRARLTLVATEKVVDYAIDDDIMRRVSEQIARSQNLRAAIENNTLYSPVLVNNENGKAW
jgi:serine/threonine protein kinase